jgi:hypothetical protein
VGRDGGDIKVIWVRSEQEYFCERGWTGKSPNSPSGKSVDPSAALMPDLQHDFVQFANPTLHRKSSAPICASPFENPDEFILEFILAR